MSARREHGEQVLSLPLYTGGAHECPYLPGRTAVNEFGFFHRLEGGVYQQLMEAGFRRSGGIVYRPACVGCRECVPMRVPVESFTLSRSQRRVLRRNEDVSVRVGQPECSDAKHQMYQAYLRAQHGGGMGESREELESFLFRSPTTTLEMTYSVGERIVAVGIVDSCPESLSSVYFFFDPQEGRRSLGIFGALCEIEECRRRGLPYWYVGYYVRACRRMNYKAGFRPHELLGPNGAWKPGDGCDPNSGLEPR